MTSISVSGTVVVFDEDTPCAALARLRPEVHCKGADYAPPAGKPVPEAGVVEGYGGRVAFLPLVEGVSTTDIVRRIRDGRRTAGLRPGVGR